MVKALLVIITCGLLFACYTPPTVQVSLPNTYRKPKIAIVGQDTLFADVIAARLKDRDYRVMTAKETRQFMAKNHIRRKNLRNDTNLVIVRDHPIDTLLVIESIDKKDNVPNRVSMSFLSPYTNLYTAQIQWVHPPDQNISLSQAADQVIDALIRQAKQNNEWGYETEQWRNVGKVTVG